MNYYLDKVGNHSQFGIATIILTLFVISFLLFPKWQFDGTNATISNEVSSHYTYLPASVIEKDLKTLKYYPNIFKKYQHSKSIIQKYHTKQGYPVISKTMGTALLYSPGFIIGHLYASKSWHAPDGYSRPYQFMIHTSSFIYAILGLIFLFLILREYYTDKVTAATLMCLCLGSNYLEYTGFNNALPQNYLVLCYALLIYLTIQFRKSSNTRIALAIGIICGLIFLIQPRQIISILIPILWGLDFKNIKSEFRNIGSNKKYLLFGMIGFCCMAILQFFYWKYVSNEWYPNNATSFKYNWFQFDFIKGLFKLNNGWLANSPILIFSIIGLFLLRNKKQIFFPLTIFILIYFYVEFASQDWSNFVSLAQSNMVQILPILAFPFAAFLERVFKIKLGVIVMMVISAILIFTNFWMIYQKYFQDNYTQSKMTSEYFSETYGKRNNADEVLKLYETNDIYTGFRNEVNQIGYKSYEADSTSWCSVKPRFCLTDETQFTPQFSLSITNQNYDWIRVNVKCFSDLLENDEWKYTQLVVNGVLDDKKINTEYIRVNRFMEANKLQEVYLDIRKQKESINKLEIFLWNAESKNTMQIESIQVETYKE